MTTPTSMPPDDGRPDASPTAPPATTTPADDANAAREPEIGDRWGTLPPPERRAVLGARLAEWAAMPDHGKLLGPFDVDGWRRPLSGADVYYLTARRIVLSNGNVARDLDQGLDELWLHGAFGVLSHLHLEHTNLYGAYLGNAVLNGVHLEHAVLIGTHLERAALRYAHLEHAILDEAYLAEASLNEAHLEHAILRLAYLEQADLSGAHLEHTDLRRANLEHTRLPEAHLEQSNLAAARLAGAVIRGAFLDAGTDLTDATVTDVEHGSVRVADVRWQGVNLAVVEWPADMVLGDEQEAWELAREPLPQTKGRKEHREAAKRRRDEVREAFRAAARANRQLAAAMRDQGMNDEADHFAYRAQVVQRELYRRSGRRARWFGSLLLDLVSGYGYQPIRSVFTYAAVIFVFAAAFFLLGASSGAHTLTWNEALVVSVTAFHGRGFFATAFRPGDPQAVVAAVEAVIGLLIEITFIATFTQRFFGK